MLYKIYIALRIWLSMNEDQKLVWLTVWMFGAAGGGAVASWCHHGDAMTRGYEGHKQGCPNEQY